MLLYCGTTAYTWKTAFDSEFAKFSPGALLVEKMTEQLFAADGIEAIESCSPEGGFMNQLWDGRRATVDLLADVGARKSLGFTAVVVGERGYRRLRGLRNRLRARHGPPCRSGGGSRRRGSYVPDTPVTGSQPPKTGSHFSGSCTRMLPRERRIGARGEMLSG